MKKLKKHHNGFISSQNGTGQLENDTKNQKVIVSIHSTPTRNREFQKKIQKIQKHHHSFISGQNGTGQAENGRKKNYLSESFQPDPE